MGLVGPVAGKHRAELCGDSRAQGMRCESRGSRTGHGWRRGLRSGSVPRSTSWPCSRTAGRSGRRPTTPASGAGHTPLEDRIPVEARSRDDHRDRRGRAGRDDRPAIRLDERRRDEKLAEIDRRGRAAFLEGAEERSRTVEGRPLTAYELERVTKRYPQEVSCE